MQRVWCRKGGRRAQKGFRPAHRFALRTACGKAAAQKQFPRQRQARRWPPLFQIPFSGTRAARDRANVILTVSCAFEKRHSFAVLRPQARAGANRAQARLLGRRLGSGAIGVTRKKNTNSPVVGAGIHIFQARGPRVLCRFLSIRKQGAFSIKRGLNVQRPFFLPHKQAARFPGKEKPEHSAPAKGENTAGRMPCACAQTKAPSPCVGEGAFYAAAFTPLPNRTAGYIPLWRCFFPAYSRLSGQGARPRSPRCGIRRWKCGAKAPCAAPRGKMGYTGSWR